MHMPCHDVSHPVSSSPCGQSPPVPCMLAVLSVVRQCHELSYRSGTHGHRLPWCSQGRKLFHLSQGKQRTSLLSPGLAPVGHCRHSGQLSLQPTCLPSYTGERDRMGTNPQDVWHPDLRCFNLAPHSLIESSEESEPILQDPCSVHKSVQP